MNKIQKYQNYRKGILAEWLAALCLILKGYRIIHKRYKTKMGEIDIIAKKANIICFVEVKFRKEFENAIYAINQKQQYNIINTANAFIRSIEKDNNNYQYRFDAFIISKQKMPKHIKNAFLAK